MCSMRRRRSSRNDGLGCIVTVLVWILFMPIVGLVFVCGKDPDRKALGWAMLVIGIILWLMLV